MDEPNISARKPGVEGIMDEAMNILQKTKDKKPDIWWQCIYEKTIKHTNERYEIRFPAYNEREMRAIFERIKNVFK